MNVQQTHEIIRGSVLPPLQMTLATGNVARVFPQLAGDRGLLVKGKRADDVITDSVNLSRVKHVLIAGKTVVKNGALLPHKMAV